MHRSLFGEILDWMLAPLLVIWPISVALTWLVAQGIANKPYDRELGEMARTLGLQVATEPGPGDNRAGRSRYALAPEAAALLRADESDTIYYQVLGLRGELLSGDQLLAIPEREPPVVPWELHFRDDEMGNESVRVAFLWVAPEGSAGSDRMMLVQVAETLGKRSRLTNEIIKGVILPQFVILPLAVLLVWLALARGIAPLNELQRRIRSRDSSDLSPIDEERIPDEVAPLVQAINDLLERLDQSIRAQKHFLADAAHQLKTPLAGLRTQAELAQREIDEGRGSPADLRRSLQHIALSSQRAAHMVNQLLAMARAEDQEHASRRSEVSLPVLAVETVRDFVPRAMEKRLDLGYEGPEPDLASLRLNGHPLLIRELIRNLVDNALLYTPAGGTITVRVVEDPFGQVCVLQVEDSGPGIAESEREKVFQPFYRALGTNVDGSGLGLAIVREIVQQHEAEISVDDTRPRRQAEAEGTGPGARFTIRFPAHPQRG
ncbi:two-component system, OmpR family, sensor histidine kinase TctE [Roseateles sp. YR242]|uniref:sensor histidine kinase n=1 Tax=Roseateles sp. YR242 TaxID=1855305 RepID=UPI0008D4C875|nr:sensor histidine kinase [Roseateles sp. YR242]SEL27763.1 two-component system, OmpR family, sensor histidine kinase TctE [Roseateles sp. YR242]